MSNNRLSDHYLPLSKTCNYTQIPESSIDTLEGHDDERVIKLMPMAKWNILKELKENMLPSIPGDLIQDLELASPDPLTWYKGQLIAYILRPNNKLQSIIQELIQNPAPAAVHVRRGDKVRSEAKLHAIEEYIEIVDEYFDIQVATGSVDNKAKRRLFVATDDPIVIEEIQRWYTRYEIIGDIDVASKANDNSLRHTTDIKEDLIRDLYRLVYADFLVCTLSSNLCSLAYALRLATKPLVTDLYDVVSLDQIHTK